MHISSAELTQFAVALFVAADVSQSDAQAVAESLVDANLRGHDSHGVVRIPGYVKQIRKGELVAGAKLDTLSESDSALAADARFGFGQVQMGKLIDRLVPKVKQQGIACGTMFNCGHVGRLGEWVERTANESLAGLITVNDNGVLQCVAPPGGTAPRISTNPLAIGVPTSNGPLVLDISTSAVANGKIKVAQVAGRLCPEGWLQDADGKPTTNPAVRFSDPRGTILPMGGTEGYKGFGLGLLLDILVGGLTGGFCPPAPPNAEGTNNVLLLLWDPERFAGSPHFLSEADKLIDYVRNSPRKEGVEQIRLPGDRSEQSHKERTDNGIPLDDGTWQRLERLAGELHVLVPGATREEASNR